MIQTIGLFLLFLLKLLGWVVLALLLILLVGLLLVLFVPVRYDIHVQNERSRKTAQKNPVANLQLQLDVTWLLHFVHVFASYDPKGLVTRIRVAGIDIPKALAWLAKRKETKAADRQEPSFAETTDSRSENRKDLGQIPEEIANKSVPQEPENSQSQAKKEAPQEAEILESQAKKEALQEAEILESQAKKGAPQEESSKEQAKKEAPQEEGSKEQAKKEAPQEESSKEQAKKGAPQEAENIKTQTGRRRKKAAKSGEKKTASKGTSEPGLYRRMRERFSRMHGEFTNESNRHAVSCLWEALFKLLRSYKPRKLNAELTFSLANPALTGEVTGLLSLMPIVYRYSCSIVPDFLSDQLYIEGEIEARGKVTVFVFLLTALRLLRDKQFMQVVRRLMKRGGA